MGFGARPETIGSAPARPSVRPRRFRIREPLFRPPNQIFEAVSFPDIFQSVNSVPTIGKAFPESSPSLEITCTNPMIRTPAKTATALKVNEDDALIDSNQFSVDLSEGSLCSVANS